MTAPSFTIRKAAQNFSWLFADKVWRFLIAVLVNAVLARYLGPGNFGLLSYAAAVCATFAFFATQGIDQWIVRELVTRPEAADRILGAVARMRLIGAMISVALALGVAAVTYYTEQDDGKTKGLLIGLIAFSAFGTSYDFPDLWFQSLNKSKWSVLSRFIGFSIANIGRLLLVWQKAPLFWFALCQVLESVLIGLAQITNLKLRGGPKLDHRNWSNEAKQILIHSWPLLFSSFTVLLYSKGDQILLAQLRSVAEVGLYASALRVIEYANVFPMILSVSIFPMLMSAYGPKSTQKTRENLESILGFVNWVVWAGVVLLYFMADRIILTLYGRQFQDATEILRILIWAIPPMFFGVTRQALLTIAKQLRVGLQFEIVVAIVLLALNLILIPLYGAKGTALSLLITSYSVNILAAIVLRPIRESALIYLRGLAHPILKFAELIGAYR